MPINTALDSLFEAAENIPRKLGYILNIDDMREHKYFATKHYIYWVDEENRLYDSEIYSQDVIDDLQFFQVYSCTSDGKYFMVFKSGNQITKDQAINLGWDI